MKREKESVSERVRECEKYNDGRRWYMEEAEVDDGVWGVKGRVRGW